MEGYPVKHLYTLVFVLFSFAAPAQTSENWIPPYYLDKVDCFGETTQGGTMSSHIMGIEQFCAAMLNDADGVATTKPKYAEDVPVEAGQPSEQNLKSKFSAGSDGGLANEETIEQSATGRIIATERTIESLGGAKPGGADDVAIIESQDAEDIPVGAVQPSEENSTVKYTIQSDDELVVDDTIEQSAVSTIATNPTIDYGEATVSKADDVTITGSNHPKNVEVGARDDQSTVGEAIE
jgi:hypothetical protein